MTFVRYWGVVSVVSALLMVASLSSTAEIYQWRDANGKLHFSDKKPKTQAAQDITHTVEKINVDESHIESEKLERLFKPETPEEKAYREREAGQLVNQEIKRQQQCDSAREYLEVLKGPVYFVREDGTEYDISESERQQKVAEMEANIRENC